MRQILQPVRRLLVAAAVLSLVVTACATDTATDDAAPPTTTWPDAGRGWLEGDDLEWSDGSAESEESAGADGELELDAAVTADALSDDRAGELIPEYPGPGAPEPPVDTSPLNAGSIDDAEDVAAFHEYRDSVVEAGVTVRPYDLHDSTLFTVVGDNGLPVLDAEVQLWAAEADRSTDAPLVTLRTTARGTARFVPNAMLESTAGPLLATVRVGEIVTDVDWQTGDAEVTVAVDAPGGIDGNVALDVHFVLDATGSMDDEIARLRDNMTTVARQIDALPSQPDVRFGMTVYRDEGDLFVTRTFDLTDDLDSFLQALAEVQADGGGDYPEAMDEALDEAMTQPEWRRTGAVELMFLIADAPPQVTRQVPVSATETALAAARTGAKIFPVAASGTDDQAEYVMRELAFVTGGRFVFLAYGDGGTATGGQSDIDSDDYSELPLDELVVKLVEDELSALTGPTAGPTSTTTLPVTTTTFEQ